MHKFVCNLHDKEKYVANLRTLKEALNCGLILTNVQKGVQFNQKTWLKSYIDLSTRLRTEAKNVFEKVLKASE